MVNSICRAILILAKKDGYTSLDNQTCIAIKYVEGGVLAKEITCRALPDYFCKIRSNNTVASARVVSAFGS